MDDSETAVRLLVSLLLFGAWFGAGIISRSVWSAVGIAVAGTFLIGIVIYLVAAGQSGAHDAYDYAFLLIFLIDLLKYLLPAAAVVAAVTSLVSNFIRRRRAPKNAK